MKFMNKLYFFNKNTIFWLTLLLKLINGAGKLVNNKQDYNYIIITFSK